ncbi:38.7 kDa protein [Buzura suppressaria nucleopolyhedrovirus]|uniref:38.7 kDa protein n=1 Tax=Buzura suppressaria nuclear polyhedrosis virus TaxID=74320 RepID=W5VKP9_NPVBS|nr:38.7 kDa protein [Buzura suppressaria nucleopolyhedrovirus]AHH82716.1 38.7 kDa protein [Buzura suppressaria nucleopolyhedrovirus]QYF10587.1 38.7k [Buzura suppressaria nucleopolyhedrovirus]
MDMFAKLFTLFFGTNSKPTQQEYDTNIGNCNNKNFENVKRNENPVIKKYSYLFEEKTLTFDNQFCFVLRYLIKNEEIWMIGYDLAAGIGFDNPNLAVNRYVQFTEWKSVNQLLFDKFTADDGIKCINRNGALQLLNNIDFKNKAEFIACLLETFNELEHFHKPSSTSIVNDDDKFDKLLEAIEAIKCNNTLLLENNTTFKTQIIDKLGAFELQFSHQIQELHNKIIQYENVEQLYTRLKKYHKTLEGSALDDCCSIFNEHQNRYETVRFPRNPSKFPRLAVYVKPDNQGTQLAIIAGQQKNMQARKRKYKDMELVYDSVHPNPLLAVHCINEELDNKNYNYSKRGKRVYHIQSDVNTVKSFINENV